MFLEPATRSRRHDRLQPRARCQRKAERPHVYARSCQDCCKLGYLTSQRGDSCPKCIRTISRLGASDFTDAQADAAIRRQFEEAHGPSPNFHPLTGVASSNASIASSTTVSTLGDSPTDYFGLGKPAVAGEERFRSLTERKWGEFEAMGFGGLDPAEKNLQFDLTESARTVRLDFGSVVLLMFTYRVAVVSGEMNDAHLDGFLVHWIHSHRRATERDPTVQHPPHELELVLAGATSRYHAQVEKDSEVSPTFGWDIEPVMGTGVIIEEAFMDVFCDLMYGSGWMEIEREEVDRECNWALVRVTVWVLCDHHPNILCPHRSNSNHFYCPGRLFLAVPTHALPPQYSFSKEFVPLEYRQQLSAGVRNKRTLGSFFSPGKTKQWKQAATLNGRHYVVLHVPRSLRSRGAEFEGLLRGNNSSTKDISFGRDGTVKQDVTPRADLVALRRVLHRDVLDRTYLLPSSCSWRRERKLPLVRLPQSSKQAPNQPSKAPETNK